MKNYLICYFILQQVMFETLEDELSALLLKISPELWENGRPADKALFEEWERVIDADSMSAEQVGESLAAKLESLGSGFEKTISVLRGDSLEYYLSQARERMHEFLCDNDLKTILLPPWEAMMKKMVWQQLGEIRGRRILDFGSGIGVTSEHYAGDNDVTAIEPSRESVENRWKDKPYCQLCGSLELIRGLEDESFDIIICHNVLEYAPDREEIVKEFARLVKKDGYISIVKHNRAGRVMQMAVLLDDPDKADLLLDGNNSTASAYGEIRYYEDNDIEKWCDRLEIQRTLGMRTFWDLQQDQERHKDIFWQDRMIKLEMRVSDFDPYRQIAFFHHLTVKRKQ